MSDISDLYYNKGECESCGKVKRRNTIDKCRECDKWNNPMVSVEYLIRALRCNHIDCSVISQDGKPCETSKEAFSVLQECLDRGIFWL